MAIFIIFDQNFGIEFDRKHESQIKHR